MARFGISTIGASVFLAQSVFAQDVQPGDTAPDVATAQVMFEQACAGQLPYFALTEQMLESTGVFAQAESGTYFHKKFNLSMKVHVNNGELACSMVFVNRGDIPQISAAVNAGIENIRNQYGPQFPNASFEVIIGEGETAGFYRLAIFMNSN